MAKKAKKPKNYDLYFKRKRLNNFFKGAVIKTAEIKKVDISTPAKLKKFYNENKESFAPLFEMGLETQLTSTTTIFNQFDVAANNEHEFYLDELGEKHLITEKEAKFRIAQIEQQLNVLLGSTGVEYSYKIGMDGIITISLPTEDEIELLVDEPVEYVNDYLSGFGIKIYTSDESKRKKFIKNEPKRRKYSDRVVQRFKQFRKEYNKEKAKSTKGKTKRKKR
jgi:hypothetical protein